MLLTNLSFPQALVIITLAFSGSSQGRPTDQQANAVAPSTPPNSRSTEQTKFTKLHNLLDVLKWANPTKTYRPGPPWICDLTVRGENKNGLPEFYIGSAIGQTKKAAEEAASEVVLTNIEREWGSDIPKRGSKPGTKAFLDKHPVASLKLLAQQLHWDEPVWTESSSGPSNRLQWSSNVQVTGKKKDGTPDIYLGFGTASDKAQAMRIAAKIALDSIYSRSDQFEARLNAAPPPAVSEPAAPAPMHESQAPTPGPQKDQQGQREISPTDELSYLMTRKGWRWERPFRIIAEGKPPTWQCVTTVYGTDEDGNPKTYSGSGVGISKEVARKMASEVVLAEIKTHLSSGYLQKENGQKPSLRSFANTSPLTALSNLLNGRKPEWTSETRGPKHDLMWFSTLTVKDKDGNSHQEDGTAPTLVLAKTEAARKVLESGVLAYLKSKP